MIQLVLQNIRSTHNVGSLLRTADGFGVDRCIMSGYTPYPLLTDDSRLPHNSRKTHQQIAKTALGAEDTVAIEYVKTITGWLDEHSANGWRILGLEQHPRSVELATYQLPSDKIILILGEEVRGIDSDILERCHDIVEIPMRGHKESFNVSVAAGICLYHLRHHAGTI